MGAGWAATACGLAAVLVGCLCAWAICRLETKARRRRLLTSRRSPYVKQRLLAFVAQLTPTSSRRGPYGRTVYMGRYNLARIEDTLATFVSAPLKKKKLFVSAFLLIFLTLERRLRGLGCRCFSLVLVNHKLLTNLSGPGLRFLVTESALRPEFVVDQPKRKLGRVFSVRIQARGGRPSPATALFPGEVMSRARIRSLAAPSRRSHGATRGNRYLNTYG